jgi:cytochrome c biogenesis protein CcmG/thiol:disulfide interchange protein DsbE
MKKKIIYLLIVFILIFIFTVFLKGLYKPNLYTPSNINNKNLIEFSGKDLFTNTEINSQHLISIKKYTVINIWASWCAPCRSEHSILMDLSKNSNLNMIGLNYKDKSESAKKFIYKLGNPFSNILVDKNGIISIKLGAYGIPETFIVNSNAEIIKTYIGPLTNNNVKEIVKIINQ